MTKALNISNGIAGTAFRRAALASVAAAPLLMGLAAPAHAQIVNTATVTGTPDSGVLPPLEVIESVTVAVPIDAVNDSVLGVDGNLGDTGVIQVLNLDTLDGNAAALGTVTITVDTPATPASPGDPVPTLNPATGAIDVPAGTPAGTYEITYQICETANANNCDTAVATIEVIASPIVADPDSVTGINGTTGEAGVLDVLDGDTLSGAAATLATVDISVTTPATAINGGLVPVLNPATGMVDVPAGTPAGVYAIVYEICEELNPGNCSTNTATITVGLPPLLAVNDTVTGADGVNGDADVLNVFTGDTVNGDPATTANATLRVDPNSAVPPELTFDPATGTVGVVAGTVAGTYSFDYEICETLNPANCRVATATVTVDPDPSLSMTKVADDTELVTVGQVITYTYTVTNDGNVTIRGVAIGDTHNGAGAAPTPSDPQLTQDNGTAGDSTDANAADDAWDVLAPGDVITFTGTYTVLQADIDNLQ